MFARSPTPLLLLADGQVWPCEGAERQDGPTAFASWCAAHPGQRCLLLIGADASVQVSPAADIAWATSDDARRYAQQMLAHFHGEEALQWPLFVWHSDGTAATRDPQDWGASAWRVAPPAMAELRAAATRHRVTLSGPLPLWFAALDRRQLDDACGAVCIHEASWVTVLRVERGRLRTVQQARVVEPTRRVRTSELLAGAHGAVRHWVMPTWQPAVPGDLPHPDARPLRPAGTPRSSACRITPFIPGAPSRAASPLAWAAVGVLAVGVSALLVDAWRAHGRRDETQAERLRWAAAVERSSKLTNAAPRAPREAAAASGGRAGTATSPAPDIAAQLAVARTMASRLQHPWPKVLHAMESSTTAGVQWLRLDHSAVDSLSRLEGEAPALAAGLAATRALNGKGVWHSAWLARAQSAKEGSSVRFEVEARLPGRAASAVATAASTP